MRRRKRRGGKIKNGEDERMEKKNGRGLSAIQPRADEAMGTRELESPNPPHLRNQEIKGKGVRKLTSTGEWSIKTQSERDAGTKTESTKTRTRPRRGRRVL